MNKNKAEKLEELLFLLKEKQIFPVKIEFDCCDNKKCESLLPSYNNHIIFITREDILQCNCQCCPLPFQDSGIYCLKEFLNDEADKMWRENYREFFTAFTKRFVERSLDMSDVLQFPEAKKIIDKYIHHFYYDLFINS